MSYQPKKIGIGFVTFLPPADCLQRIELACRLGFRVYVHDNSPSPRSLSASQLARCGAHYTATGENAGLGVGISSVCANAFADHLSALLFFDQDTIFDERTLDFVEQFHAQQGSRYADSYSLIVFSGESSGSKLATSNFVVQEVRLAISSGSLFFLSNLQVLGWHNRSYFVDGVDYDICLRSLIKGFHVGKCFDTPGFDHLTGQPDRVINLCGKKLQLRRYSFARIADASSAYLKLLATSVGGGQFGFALAIVRSSFIYFSGQILARIVIR